MAPNDRDGFFRIVSVLGTSNTSSNICWSGGEILGQYAPSTLYDSLTDQNNMTAHGMHDKYGMMLGHEGYVPGIQVENVKLFDYGDGISFDGVLDPTNTFTIRNVHIRYSRDDCIEDDSYLGGTIYGAFLDGCYSGLSARSSSRPNSGNAITMSYSLIRMQSMDIVYESGSAAHPDSNKVGPNHNAFWKWNLEDGHIGPQLNLYYNVFRADGPRDGYVNPSNQEFMAPPPGRLSACEGNVITWFGAGSFAAAIPTEQNPEVQYGSACFKVVSGAAAQTTWDSAVAVWQANWDAEHPNPPADLAPPIVSMFYPGPLGWVTEPVPLTGLVTLVATAVDDRAVTSVQFKMTPIEGGSPYSIGAGVTVASGDATSANGYAGPTKYRLASWNSALVPDGTYHLTATAWDGNDQSKTSDPITVTVNNPRITSWSYSTGGGFGATWGLASVTTSHTIQSVSSWIYYATPGYSTYASDSQWGGVGYTYYGLRSAGLPGSCVDMAASIQVQLSGNWEGNTQDGCP